MSEIEKHQEAEFQTSALDGEKPIEASSVCHEAHTEVRPLDEQNKPNYLKGMQLYLLTFG